MGSSVDQYAVLALLFIASLPKTPAQQISWDSGCGSSKGCFPDCTGGCDYLVTWADSGSNIVFTMSHVESDAATYLAIAFSNDYRMGEDSVVGCLSPSNGLNYVYSYYNEGTETEELSPVTLGLSSTSASQTNGIISCSFTRSYSEANSKYFDLREDYFIQLVIGEASGSHMGRHTAIPWFSDKKVDFQSNEIVGAYKLNSPLVKLHGIMSVLAWLLFSILGIFTARYNRDMMPETKLFGAKIWFQLHRGLMIAMLVCLLIAFIPIFVEIEGYSQIPSEGPSKAHPVFGIILTALAVVNPIAALVRPGPDHKFRWIFNWGHFFLGLGTQGLAILTIFFGYILDRSVLSDAPAITTGVQLAVIFVFVVALEMHKWFGKKNQASVDINMDTTPVENGVEEKKAPVEKKPEQSNLPLILLVLFGIAMSVFAIAVLGIIAAG